MADRLGIGVVGAGALARRLLRHLVLDDASELVEVRSVCDPVLERAEAVGREFGIPSAVADPEALNDDPTVDVVTICTPIHLHHEQVMQSLAAGKHVHVNKTMAMTAREASEQIGLAEQQGLVLLPSPGEVLRPHLQATRALVAGGAVGTVCWAACGAAFGSYHLDPHDRRDEGDVPAPDPSWYWTSPGGGPVYDMTVYALHGLTTVLGSVRRVTAMSSIRIPEHMFGDRRIVTSAHDNTLMLLDFGDGLLAFAYGAAAGNLGQGAGGDFRGRYYGTAGELVGLQLNGEPFDYDGRELAEQDPAHGQQWILPYVTEPHRDLPEQHVYADVMELVTAVRDGRPPRVTASHARHVVEIIEAGYAAASTGRTHELVTSVDGLRDHEEPSA